MISVILGAFDELLVVVAHAVRRQHYRLRVGCVFAGLSERSREFQPKPHWFLSSTRS